MGSRAVRSLTLACSLLLALPQGWCCTFACSQTKATATANDTKANDIPGEVGGCCPHCPHESKPSNGPTHKPTPGEQPSPPTSSVCSCADPRALPPSTSSIEQTDTGIVLFLPPPANVVTGVGQRAAVVGTDVRPPTSRPHVLNCVWLR